MSDPAQNVKPLQQPKTYTLPAGQAFLAGRISSRRKMNTQDGSMFLTVVKLPAPDSFSSPATVELQSRSPIGAAGEDWSGFVMLSGFSNNFDSKPDQDGEVHKILSARNHFVVIEA